MPTDTDPIVENWYENQEENHRFKVIALDDAIGTVEIQHYDGSLEEIDIETWYLLDIEQIDNPDSWAGALDDLEQNDSDYMDSELATDTWDTIPQAARSTDIPADSVNNNPVDEWGEGFPEEEPWDEEG